MVALTVALKGNDEILNELQSLEKRDLRKVLKSAVNETTRKARTITIRNGVRTYEVKRKDLTDQERGNSIEVTKATAAKPIAYVKSTGRINSPIRYKAQPTSLIEQQHRKLAAKAKILRQGHMKQIIVHGNKAFYTEIHNNEESVHRMIAVRRRKSRLPIDEIYSPSYPHAVMSGRSIEAIEPEIRQQLLTSLNKHIEKVLNK